MGGRPEHDWIEILIEDDCGIFLTQKFKEGIEFDEYLYPDDNCDEFVSRTSLGKWKRNGSLLKPKNENLKQKMT